VSPEVAASVSVQTAPSKPARSQASQPDSGFGALVDSNTAAAASTQSQDPAPRRADAPAAADRARDPSATDQPAQRGANDTSDASAPADSNPAPDPAKAPGKKAKSDATGSKSSKTDDAKADGTDGTTDGLAAVGIAADPSQPDPTALVTPDPTAIAVPVVVTPVDAGAAAGPARSGDSPLTIAAAGIAASASTAAQITAPTPAKPDAAGVVGDATTRPAGTDAATLATTGGKPADPQANTGLTAAVDQTTPKTSFKAAATAQPRTDASALTDTQDTTKPNTAGVTPNPAQAATANAAAHPQATKPETDVKAVDTKADASDRAAAGPQPAPSSHDHAAAAQVQTVTADTSTQAASALQAPLTTTTSTAGASTATLTVTAATTSAAVPLNALPVEIAASARNGKTRFEISLDPAELGRIDVRIAVDRNGQVTSHLTVEKPETLSMLRQDAPQLQRALDDAGLKTGSNGLSFSLRDQSSSGQQNNASDNGGNARRLIVTDEDAVPAAAAAGRGYGRMLGSSSGVDIRV
jgi:flagellar hook-length control protein FliK